MRFHTALEIYELSDVTQALRIAAELAASLGFDRETTSRTATVATDLGGYLCLQSGGGRLLISTAGPEGRSQQVEFVVLATDDPGAGVRHVNQVEQLHSRPAEAWLDAVRQHSEVFDVYSSPGVGTVVLSRVGVVPSAASQADPYPIVFGGICVPVVGETVSGDAWSVVVDGARASILLADGLGHGPGAAEASAAAVDTFLSDPFAMPSQLLDSAHAALRHTRGAAVAMVRADLSNLELTFCGAGNVAGRLLSGVTDRGIISQPGTVGLQIRTLKDVRYDWPEHALLILHSDGIVSRWDFDGVPDLIRCHPTLIAAWLLLAHSRGRDDATAVVVRRDAS